MSKRRMRYSSVVIVRSVLAPVKVNVVEHGVVATAACCSHRELHPCGHSGSLLSARSRAKAVRSRGRYRAQGKSYSSGKSPLDLVSLSFERDRLDLVRLGKVT